MKKLNKDKKAQEQNAAKSRKKGHGFWIPAFCLALACAIAAGPITAEAAVSPTIAASNVGGLSGRSGADEAKPKLQVTDEKQKTWEIEKVTQVDLFKDSYSNSSEKASNGDKIIAPGTLNSYKFTLSNNGTTVLKYEISLEVNPTPKDIPLEWCLLESGKQPGSNNWKNYNDNPAPSVLAESEISAGQKKDYTIWWRWIFERGESMDEVDTYIGNLAAEGENPGVTATIIVKAEEIIEGSSSSNDSSETDPSSKPGPSGGSGETDPSSKPGPSGGSGETDPSSKPGPSSGSDDEKPSDSGGDPGDKTDPDHGNDPGDNTRPNHGDDSGNGNRPSHGGNSGGGPDSGGGPGSPTGPTPYAGASDDPYSSALVDENPDGAADGSLPVSVITLEDGSPVDSDGESQLVIDLIPKTGDTAKPLLYTCLFVGAIVGLLVIFVLARRLKEADGAQDDKK